MIRREDENHESFAHEAVSGTFLALTPESTILLKTDAQIEDQDTQFGALIRGMAHQLSSPLGALLTNLSLAQEDFRAALGESKTNQDAALVRMKTAMEDLDDALGLVRRLNQLADTMKRWGRTSSPTEIDMREALSLIASSANSLTSHNNKVTYLFESPSSPGGPADCADPWTVRTQFIPLACTVLDIIAACGTIAPREGTRPASKHSIRLIAQPRDEWVRLVVEIRSIDTVPLSQVTPVTERDLSAIRRRLERTNILLESEPTDGTHHCIVLLIPRPQTPSPSVHQKRH